MEKGFNKDYRVAINTVPIPEEPEVRARIITESINPVINQIVSDVFKYVMGITWPTPENNPHGGGIKKDYSVAINTVPIPEEPSELTSVVLESISPVFNQIISDAIKIAFSEGPVSKMPL